MLKLSTTTYLAPLLLSTVLASCATPDNSGPSQSPTIANVAPTCVEGCQNPDPSPTAPGYYLGTNGLPVNCIGSDYSPDADLDDLGDACETLLASTFAPLLKYESDNDYLAREPHWAARWVTTGSTARIIYLLSYYKDLGNSNSLCATFQPAWCEDGHVGDSEWLTLDVTYNSTTKHWVLTRAEYSEHTGSSIFSGNPYPTALEYSDRLGGYPTAWVSIGKHANYESFAHCNTGIFNHYDYCDATPLSARVANGANVNIGSSTYHTAAQDCIASSNINHPYYADHQLECYWSGAKFGGWYPTWLPDSRASPYGPKLVAQGF